MDTSTNMATSTDMGADNLSILINATAFQEPWSDPTPQVNGLYLSFDASVNTNDNNDFQSLFHTDSVSYKDFFYADIFYEGKVAIYGLVQANQLKIVKGVVKLLSI